MSILIRRIGTSLLGARFERLKIPKKIETSFVVLSMITYDTLAIGGRVFHLWEKSVEKGVGILPSTG